MQLQPTPRGFEHINRYFDTVNHRYAAKLLPGQFYISRSETLVTVVGTGVVACIRDRSQRLGGMNHFLEPHATTGAVSSPGEDAMFDLFTTLLDAGAQRDHLEAKLFGGSRILSEDCMVGERSIALARLFLGQANIPIVEEDLGGPFARKIDYQPVDGRVRIKHLRDIRNDTILERDRHFVERYRGAPRPGDRDNPCG